VRFSFTSHRHSADSKKFFQSSPVDFLKLSRSGDISRRRDRTKNLAAVHDGRIQNYDGDALSEFHSDINKACIGFAHIEVIKFWALVGANPMQALLASYWKSDNASPS
jgi:hypothetical protein